MTIDYETISPGVRRLVRLLTAYGFNTTDSGDGSTHAAAPTCWCRGASS